MRRFIVLAVVAAVLSSSLMGCGRSTPSDSENSREPKVAESAPAKEPSPPPKAEPTVPPPPEKKVEKAPPAPRNPNDPIQLNVNARGAILIPGRDKPATATQIRDYVRTSAREAATPPRKLNESSVVIRAENATPYAVVRRLLEQCQASGFTRFTLQVGSNGKGSDASVSFQMDPARPADEAVLVDESDPPPLRLRVAPQTDGRGTSVRIAIMKDGNERIVTLAGLDGTIRAPGKKFPAVVVVADQRLQCGLVFPVLETCRKAGITTLGSRITEEDLMNDEIGIDPSLPADYNVDRIEEVTVPGPVNPKDKVGIKGAPDAPPKTLPPPPGFGAPKKKP
jgi:biopolymer transport protein ExbD